MAQSTPEEFFALDWRQALPRDQLLGKLDEFRSSIDSSWQANLHLSNSTAKRIVPCNESGLKYDMFLHKKVVHVKKYRGGNDQSASITDQYIGRLELVMQHVMQAIDASEQGTRRNLWYRLDTDKFKIPQVDQILKDLALSIKVHPYQLGMVPEMGQSQVRIPQGSSLEVEEVNNIFAYSKKLQGRVRTYKGGDVNSIAAMYKSVKVREEATKIRAVVVCEHRSIKEKVERHVDQPGFEGILLVMTGGFPDVGCREFLHLLAANRKLINDKVPFLWLSDCDAHSLQMYSVLKFGSAGHAYASASMICPQLTFGGLTMEKFEEFARGRPQRALDTALKTRALTDAEQEKFRQDQSRIVEKKLRSLKTLPSSIPDKGDRQRIKGIKKARTLELPGEDLALAQLNYLDAGGSKMSFFRLDTFEEVGAAFFIAEQVAALRGETLEVPAIFGDFDSQRQAWNANSQRVTSQELGELRVSAPVEVARRELNDEEFELI